MCGDTGKPFFSTPDARVQSCYHAPKVTPMQVTEIETCIGEGTKENPNRTVRYYYDREGKLLAWYDPQDEVDRRRFSDGAERT